MKEKIKTARAPGTGRLQYIHTLNQQFKGGGGGGGADAHRTGRVGTMEGRRVSLPQ